MSDLELLLRKAASQYGLDPGLLRRVVMQESSGNPNTLSPAGAIGYMQLMPGTARELGVNPYNPSENVMGGARYLSEGIRKYGLEGGLRRYNAGRPNARNPETDTYVSRITGGKGLGKLPQNRSAAPGRGQAAARPNVAAPSPAPGQAFNDPYAGTADTLIKRLMGSIGAPVQNPYTTPQPQLAQALHLDPSLTPLLLEGALAREAAQAPNAFDTQRAGTESQLAGNQALFDYYAQHPMPQATAPHFQYPQVPQRDQLPLPARPAPRTDLGGSLIGLLGGLIDPHAAGVYNAAPLQAATNYADQQYRDNLTRYQLGTEQANDRYADQRFGYGQSVDEQIRNLEAAQETERINQGREIARTSQLAAPSADIAANRSLLTTLPALSQEQQGADLARNQLGVVGNYIAQTDAQDRRLTGNDTKLLGILGNVLSRSQNALYQQAMAGEAQKRTGIQGQNADTQAARAAEQARHNQEMEKIRAAAKKQTEADPVMNEYRKLRNQLMGRKLNEAILNPQQKADLAAAKMDAANAESLFRQAMGHRNYLDGLIATGKIDQATFGADPIIERQKAYQQTEEARTMLSQSLARYQSMVNGLPAAVAPSGVTTPAPTGQTNLPANPKAGAKKTPPKAPAGKKTLRYDPATGQFH